MNLQNDEVTKAARHWLKQNKKKIMSTFCDDTRYPSEEVPVTMFMAGTPGAGKTEFSKSLITTFGYAIIRIDADEIREMMREIGYNGKNAALYQPAVSGAVSNLYRHVINKKQSALIDGTFAYPDWRQKLDESFRNNRIVEIYYLYQDPEVAWRFVQAREKKQGRAVPGEVFVHDYFACIENVSKAKALYGDKLTVYFVRHDYEKSSEYVMIDVGSIADNLPRSYSKEELQSLIQTDD